MTAVERSMIHESGGKAKIVNRVWLPEPKVEQITSTDGRVRRSERTTANIVSAYLFLVRHGLREPTMKEVAHVADCALRSVYERMLDVPTLRIAALDRAIKEAVPSTRLKVDRLRQELRLLVAVRSRIEEYELWGPLWWVMAKQDHSGNVKNRLTQLRRKLSRDGLNMFCRSTFEGGSDMREEWLRLVDVAMGLESWWHLRHFEGLSIEEVCARWGWCLDRLLVAAQENATRSTDAAPSR